MFSRKNLPWYAVTVVCLAIAWARGTLWQWGTLDAAANAVFGYLMVVATIRTYVWQYRYRVIRELDRKGLLYLAMIREAMNAKPYCD